MSQWQAFPDTVVTHGILLLSQNLARRLEVDTQHALIALVRQANVLDGRDVEGSDEPVDRQDDRRFGFVHVDLGGCASSA